MKYLKTYASSEVILKIGKELEEISFILEDEGIETNFRSGSARHDHKDKKWEPDAYYWISGIESKHKRAEILSSDYFEEFIDRATQICQSHGYHIDRAEDTRYSLKDIVYHIDEISK